MKIYVDIIHGDKKRDAFMHACDVFENSKVLGDYDALVVTAEEDAKLDELCDNLKDAYEKCGRIVSFVSIKRVDDTFTNDYKRYIRPETSAISNGNNWGLFRDVLKKIGYEAETNENMRVTSAKLVW